MLLIWKNRQGASQKNGIGYLRRVNRVWVKPGWDLRVSRRWAEVARVWVLDEVRVVDRR